MSSHKSIKMLSGNQKILHHWMKILTPLWDVGPLILVLCHNFGWSLFIRLSHHPIMKSALLVNKMHMEIVKKNWSYKKSCIDLFLGQNVFCQTLLLTCCLKPNCLSHAICIVYTRYTYPTSKMYTTEEEIEVVGLVSSFSKLHDTIPTMGAGLVWLCLEKLRFTVTFILPIIMVRCKCIPMIHNLGQIWNLCRFKCCLMDYLYFFFNINVVQLWYTSVKNSRQDPKLFINFSKCIHVQLNL